ncbi:serine-rich adhesin for platelets-like [Dysidea avara]|uniref:serine-rich adhesin for platelets-like n=1 Tax=Dysidea avara TaxID=196820 RepID=UPI003323FF25
MEELTRLQTSRRAYRSHVTRIFNKIEDTLTHEIDELAITYLRTAVTQLEKKLDQIVKIDQEICGLIEDANTLEDTIMDSEELQDTIAEKINELNKRIELLSQPSSKKSGDCRETVATETSIENIENVSTTNSVSVSSSTSHTPTYTVSAVSTTTTTAITNTSTAMSTVPLLTPTIFSTSTLSFQLVPSYSISAANPSVSYIHSLGPPPLIPRVTNPSQYGSLPITMDHPLLLPSLSTLNLSTSTSPSLARVPTIEPRANPSLTEVMPTTSSNVTGRTHSQQFTASRLPKLTLPTFSGNPLHWLTFWDSFQAAIHLNPNLSAVQKFNYLKAQVDGDAAKTIEGFPLSDQNYLHAVTILQDRFGQTHKLVAAHMQALLEVASPSNTLTSLRTFHDVINSHSRGLSPLGKSEDTYGDLLVPIILNKLPKETRQNLARDTTTPELTFSQLMAAILKEIRILETSNSTSYKSYSTAAFVVGSKPPRTNKSQDKGPQTCVYCKGTHATNQCTTVVDYQRRLEVVRQNHLCFNCLARHKVSQCTSKSDTSRRQYCVNINDSLTE